MKFLVTGALAVMLAFALVACDPGDSTDATVGPGTPTPVSDEEYLRVTCTGLQKFSDALVSKAKPEDIRAVIAAYVADLQAISPPTDIAKFHAEYIAYLQAAESEPLKLTTEPPLPPEKARQRIAVKESQVEECKHPTFFSDDYQD
ncbi:hypothetical protein AYO38_04005 [bacterium SCGC AG-212-C10]|nr:hypothetical protein AYO38_04005 [bacterium SCGC AG-212-C10]